MWGLNRELLKKGKRKCKSCQQILNISNFWKDKRNQGGLDTRCKDCCKARQRSEWKRFGSQPIRTYQKLQQLCLGIRSKKGHSQHKLKITKDEFIEWFNRQDKNCVYCGLDLEEFVKVRKHFGKLAQKTNKLGIDRKENNLPYTLDNIVLCCQN